MKRNMKKISFVAVVAALFLFATAVALVAATYDSPASIAPSMAVFDKNNPADVVYTLTNASEVKRITFFGGVMVNSSNYKFDAKKHTLTFIKEELKILGNYVGTVETDNGNVSAYLNLTDTATGAASMEETGIQIFDKLKPSDIKYTLKNVGHIQRVKYEMGEEETGDLTEGKDYEYSNGILTIKKDCLNSAKTGATYSVTITTDNTIHPTSSGYARFAVCIIVTDSTPGAPEIDTKSKEALTAKGVDTNATASAGAVTDVTATQKFEAADITVADGLAYIKDDTATEILLKGATERKEKIVEVKPLPIFKASLDKGKIAAISLRVKGSVIKETADTIETIDIRKLTSKTGVLQFQRITDLSAVKDGTFAVLDCNGNLTSGLVDANLVYEIIMFVQDNGNFDIDATDGVIVDPATLVKAEGETPTPTPSSSSSSGGCNAGFGALAVLMALPMFCRKKK